MIGKGANDAGLQVYGSTGHAQFFLRHARAEGQAGKCHHGIRVRMFFDQSVNLSDRGHDQLRNHFEAFTQMPQLGVGDGCTGLRGAAHRQEADALRLDQCLKYRVRENRGPVSAGPECCAERDEGMHIAGASHRRQ